MDISDVKFIVNSGCSYGVMLKSVFRYDTDILVNTKQKIISIDVSLDSMGSDWQSDATIFVISKLIENGVSPDNIFCLVEWSDWDRVSYSIPQISNLNPNELQWEDEFMLSGNRIKQINDNNSDSSNKNELELFIYSLLSELKKFENIGNIESSIYCTPYHLSDDVFSNYDIGYNIWVEESKKINDSLPPEMKLKFYINNILKTQWFLKLNKISYNFFQMQSSFTNWYIDTDSNVANHIYRKINHYYYFNGVEFKEKFDTLNNIESDVENVFDSLKNFIKLIDFSNFWFYESEKIRRGGVDEWAFDTFKETGYSGLDDQTGEMVEFISPGPGYHPSEQFYFLLWNRVCKNCNFIRVNEEYEKKFIKKFLEDYNNQSETICSINKITCSINWLKNKLKQKQIKIL